VNGSTDGVITTQTAVRLDEYAPLVEGIAQRIRKFIPKRMDMGDMLGDGLVGLLEAAQRYQPGRGVNFRTYATTRIRGAILDGLRRFDWAPRRLRRQAREASARTSDLCQKYGRMPSILELAQTLDMSPARLAAMNAALHASYVQSLDEVAARSSHADTVLPEERFQERDGGISSNLEDGERHSLLAQAIDSLSERERTIISLLYYEALPTREVAWIMKVKPPRITFLRDRALRKLRNFMAAYGATTCTDL